MYNITFYYFNKEPNVSCYNITEIACDAGIGSGMKVISGQDIMKYNFKRYSTMSLHSDTSNYLVSCENLMYFEIQKA